MVQPCEKQRITISLMHSTLISWFVNKHKSGILLTHSNAGVVLQATMLRERVSQARPHFSMAVVDGLIYLSVIMGFVRHVML